MASAGCAIWRRRGRARSRPWHASWCASGLPATDGGDMGRAWAQDVVARRVISWLSHAALLLDGDGKRPVRDLHAHPGRAGHVPGHHLAQRARRLSAPAGADRAGQGRSVHRRPRPPARSLHAVAGRRARSADPSRWLPRRPQSGDPDRADARPVAAAAMLWRTRHQARPGPVGDDLPAWRRCCARCCWATACPPASTASASRSATRSPRSLAYDHSPPISPATAPPSGYLRIERGSTVIVMDVGAPPDLEMAGGACAGALSFEMSTGSDLLLVNAGRPTAPDAHARALARSTASHNTLCLNDQSSSTLIRNARLEQVIGAVPIRHPDIVKCTVHQDEAGIAVDASHDGYLARFSLIHARKLQLDATGTRLDGVDTLSAAKGVLRLGLGPAVRHSSSTCIRKSRPASARRPMSQRWRWTPASFGGCRSRVPRYRSRTAPISPMLRGPAPHSASYCAECAAAPPRWPGGWSVSARAACSMPRRATASARKSGRPRWMRSDGTSYFAPAVSRQISVLTG